MKSRKRLDEDLGSWAEAGLIRPDQVEAISRYEARRGPAPEPGVVVEMIAYAGAVVALAGLGILYQKDYADLGSVGRVAALLAVALGAAAAAVILQGSTQSPPLRRAQAAALSLAAVSLGLTAGQFQIESLGGAARLDFDAGARVGLAASLLTAAVAGSFLARTGAGLLAVVVSASAFASAMFFLGQAHLDAWRAELVWLIVGGLLVAAAELGRREDHRWAAEILAFAGLVLPALATYAIAGKGHLGMELLGGGLAAAGFGAAALRGSGGYAIAAGAALFAFVVDIEIRYFSDTVGFPAVLISAGLALVLIAFALFRLLPSMLARRDRQPALD